MSTEESELLSVVGDRVNMFDFGGPLSFGAAADVGHHVRERVKNKAQAMVLDFSRVPFVDVSAARAVETIACDARHAGKHVFISGMSEPIRKVLTGLNSDHCIPPSAYFATRVEALRAAVEYCTGAGREQGNASADTEGEQGVQATA
jgi:SulP family sulfate permease